MKRPAARAAVRAAKKRTQVGQAYLWLAQSIVLVVSRFCSLWKERDKHGVRCCWSDTPAPASSEDASNGCFLSRAGEKGRVKP